MMLQPLKLFLLAVAKKDLNNNDIAELHALVSLRGVE